MPKFPPLFHPLPGALAALLLLAGCTDADGDRDNPPEVTDIATPGPAPAAGPDTPDAGSGAIVFAANDLCDFSPEPNADRATLELVGTIGDFTLYAESGGLACSEPAGASGDCDIAKGERVVVTRDTASEDVVVEALQSNASLVLSPEGLACREAGAL